MINFLLKTKKTSEFNPNRKRWLIIPFSGLLMGCSRNFWAGNIMKIFKIAGTESFTWSQIMTTYPDMTKSILSRLKCSGWIQKDKRPIIINGKPKPSKTVLWRLHPEAITLCKNGGYVTKPNPKKIIKKTDAKTCSCPSKKIIKSNK